MKHLFYFFLLFVSLSANASSYFTVVGAINDTLRINPDDLGDFTHIVFRAHFDGYVDNWRMDLTYPLEESMQYTRIERGTDMSIPYLKSDGTEDIYEAGLTITPMNGLSSTYNGGVSISSTITGYGYWDYNNDGIYEPYGKIKWDGGDHDDFFKVFYFLNADCSGDSITIDGQMTSTHDSRGYVVTIADFYKVIHLVVAYQRGDADGDGEVDVEDVTAIIGYLQDPDGSDWSQYNIAAADLNGDGRISIGDVTALVAILMSNGTDSEELNDIQSLIMNVQMNGGGQGACYAPYSQSGIGELTTMPQRAVDQNYYNLMGQPVGTDVPTTPGIYIHQGKKICVSPMR